MGKRARATSRSPRNAVSGSGKPDINIDVPVGGTGNTASETGDSGVDGSIIDPTSIGRNASSTDSDGSGDSGTGSAAERTRRPYKRRAAKTPDAVSLDIGSFRDLLYSGHAMLHSITQSVLFEIDENDADKMAKAIANVTRHYDVPQMAQKTVDWIMCIQTMGAVYGPRIMAIRMERAARNARPAPQSVHAPRNVAPSPTAPGPQPQRAAPPTDELPRGQPAPSPTDKVQPPTQPAPAPNGPVRRQPGISDLDGASLPLKFN